VQVGDNSVASATTMEVIDGMALVTISRPSVMNALNAAAIGELTSHFGRIESDPEVRGAILTGAGDRAFIAGADISELAGATSLEATESASAGQELFTLIETLGKPVIAAVNGIALGGGCEAAMACTMRLAVPSAAFGQPEVKLGLIPGFGGTQRLPRLVGKGRALRIILSGDAISAAEAHSIGLVDEIVEPDRLIDRAKEILLSISRNGPVAVRHAIAAVNAAADVPLATGLALERALFGVCAATRDKAEGTSAFLEKRRPMFTGS
jgi:enoyl-CoA hydratase